MWHDDLWKILPRLLLCTTPETKSNTVQCTDHSITANKVWKHDSHLPLLLLFGGIISIAFLPWQQMTLIRALLPRLRVVVRPECRTTAVPSKLVGAKMKNYIKLHLISSFFQRAKQKIHLYLYFVVIRHLALVHRLSPENPLDHRAVHYFLPLLGQALHYYHHYFPLPFCNNFAVAFVFECFF